MKRRFNLLLFLASIPIVSAQYFPSTYSSRGYFGFFPSLNFLDIYSSFGIYIDAVIYMLIFLGLGKMVFGAKEKEHPGYRSIYIGLALMLTIGLLLFQGTRGFSILELFGPWTVTVLYFLVLAAMAGTVAMFTDNKWMIGGVTVATGIFFLDGLNSYFGGNTLLSFLDPVLDGGGRFLVLLLALAIIIFAAWKLHKPGVIEEAVVVPGSPAAKKLKAKKKKGKRMWDSWFPKKEKEPAPSIAEQAERGYDEKGRPIREAVFTPVSPPAITTGTGIISREAQARIKELEEEKEDFHAQLQILANAASEEIKKARKEADEKARKDLWGSIQALQKSD